MKKLLSIFAALCLIALSIVACSKQDEKNNNDSSDNAITTDFLVGNWQPIEFEIDGLKISNNPSYQKQWNCLKQTVYTFTKTQLSIAASQFDVDNDRCVRNIGAFTYSINKNKLILVDTEGRTVVDIAKEGDYLSTITKDNNGKTQKYTFRKVANNGGNNNSNNDNNNNNTAKTATAQIIVSGVTDGVKVWVAETPFRGSVFLLESATVVNGKASIDVSGYIGKKLYFIVRKDNEYLSTEVAKTITEGDNAITLTAVAKSYTAKIKVLSNGTPVNNKKVYATINVSFLGIQALLIMSKGNAEQIPANNIKAAVNTNAEGIAVFENLKPEVSNLNSYTFFVVTSLEPYYQKVECTMDGTAQEATITLSESQTQERKVPVTFYVKDANNKAVKDAKVTVGTEVGTTDYLGLVDIQAPVNTQINYTVKTLCNQTKTGSYTTNPHITNMVMVTLTSAENCNSKGTLTLKNTSSNPYTVKVGNRTFVMEGKSTETLEVALETYTVSWKQNSGYMFYPTEGSTTAEFSSNRKSITISFP